MALPTVYKWDDVDAPALTNAIGSMSNLLETVLVDGYGEKEAAGWTKEFDDGANTIVLRNSAVTGNGVFLKVNDSVVGTTYVQGYELMTSISDGIAPFHTLDVSWTKPSSATEARPWILITDEKWFYLFIWPLTTLMDDNCTSQRMFFFGDFTNTNVGGTNSCMGWNHAGSYSFTLPFTNAISMELAPPQAIYSPRAADSTIEPTQFWYEGGGGPWAYKNNYAAGARDIIGAPFDVNATLYQRRPLLGNYQSFNARGFLPGLSWPCHNWDTIPPNQEVTHSERTFFNIRSVGAYSSKRGHQNMFIEIGKEWGV